MLVVVMEVEAARLGFESEGLDQVDSPRTGVDFERAFCHCGCLMVDHQRQV